MTEHLEQPERHRLADPFVCLVCGGEVPDGTHFCCSEQTWGDRFTYEVTREERRDKIAEIADHLRWTYQTAEVFVEDNPYRLGDYRQKAAAFRDALQAFRIRGEHRDPCEDCADVTAAEEWMNTAVDLAWWQSRPGRCAVAQLHVTLVVLALSEDRRHGLEQGNTLAAVARRGRERRVAEQLERLQGASVGEIVDRALNGGA